MKPAVTADKRAQYNLVGADYRNQDFTHWSLNRFQCRWSSSARLALLTRWAFLRLSTTKSIVARDFILNRKLSRTIRLIRFLSMARAVCFFAIARPNRGALAPDCLASTVKAVPDDFFAFAKTCLKSPGLRNRRSRPNDVPLAVGKIKSNRVIYYGASLLRPLARRALRTLRPLRVLMRALKPCVRARFKLLG